jgi:hypothetical protein
VPSGIGVLSVRATSEVSSGHALLQVGVAGEAFAAQRFLQGLQLSRRRQRAAPLAPVGEAHALERAVQGVAEARAGKARALERQQRLGLVLGTAFRRARARVLARELREAVHPPVALEHARRHARRRQRGGRLELQARQRCRGEVGAAASRSPPPRPRCRAGAANPRAIASRSSFSGRRADRVAVQQPAERRACASAS